MLPESFFKNAKLSNCLDMYDRALRNNAKGDLDKISQHELGQRLGMRHKFAAGEGDHIRSERRGLLIQAYHWPPSTNDQDVKQTQGVYAWKQPETSLNVNSSEASIGFQKGANSTVLARSDGIDVCLMYFFLSTNIYVFLESVVLNAYLSVAQVKSFSDTR